MSDNLDREAKAAITILGELYEQRTSLISQLKACNDQIGGHEEALKATTPTGIYKFKDWVCKLEEKIDNGRRSTSWKEVAETVNAGIGLVTDKVTVKFPEAEKALRTLSKKLSKYYNDTLEEKTKEPTQTTKIVVSVERLS